jgi:hypothetical protein
MSNKNGHSPWKIGFIGKVSREIVDSEGSKRTMPDFMKGDLRQGHSFDYFVRFDICYNQILWRNAAIF